MGQVRIQCICDTVPQDDLWFVVTLNDEGCVVYPKNTDDVFGYGSINYSGDARRYGFSLYWLDDGVAGTDWLDRQYKAADLSILDKRLVPGETVEYTEKAGKWLYRITSITAVN